jgi:hypothetical protein
VFEAARVPAYVLLLDLGPEIGTRTSSARITDHYSTHELVGRLAVGVVNFPAKQIGPVRSECLRVLHDQFVNALPFLQTSNVVIDADSLTPTELAATIVESLSG